MRRLFAVVSLGLAAALSVAAPAAAQTPPVHADFNGDGLADLAVGIQFEDVSPGNADEGAVQVFYGGNGGLTATDDQSWTQTAAGGTSESGDQFGSSAAAGDFDHDGFADLAVGAEAEDLGAADAAGAVTIIYGSASGLSAARAQSFHQNSPNILEGAETGDLFGHSVATGDFDGDGFADLAIGASGEGLGSTALAGAVHVIYGSATGLTSTGNQLFHQDSPGIAGKAEDADELGSSLAAGDFNGDGDDDLAVGSFDGIGGPSGPGAGDGAVNVLYGSSPDGLGSAGNQFWHQNSKGVQGVSESNDAFGGSALAAGDFDADGFADLAIGARFEGVGAVNDAGVVNVLYGTGSGLSALGDQYWHEDSPGVLDSVEQADRFGSSLAAADYNGDDIIDLAVGASSEDFGSTNAAGAVTVLLGSASGLSGAGSQFWHQSSAGTICCQVTDPAEASDEFGASLAGGDFNGDGAADLAVGVPGEALGASTSAGAVNVLYGSESALTAVGHQFWHQDVTGVEGSAESNDAFGRVVAAGGPTGGAD